MRKPAVWHVQPLRRRCASERAAIYKVHVLERTLIARHNQRGAAAEDGELTSLPRAAQQVSSALRPLRDGMLVAHPRMSV